MRSPGRVGAAGPSYGFDLESAHEVDAETGWIRDFADVQRAFEPLAEQLDHTVLNGVEGLDNPTSENLAGGSGIG